MYYVLCIIMYYEMCKEKLKIKAMKNKSMRKMRTVKRTVKMYTQV